MVREVEGLACSTPSIQIHAQPSGTAQPVLQMGDVCLPNHFLRPLGHVDGADAVHLGPIVEMSDAEGGDEAEQLDRDGRGTCPRFFSRSSEKGGTVFCRKRENGSTLVPRVASGLQLHPNEGVASGFCFRPFDWP